MDLHNSELQLCLFMNITVTWNHIFSSYILILTICMARAFYKPGDTSYSAGFSVSNVLLVSPSFLFSLLHKGMLTVASCMCGLSNLYSESVKKLRTSYLSKSSHGNKIFLNIWTCFFFFYLFTHHKYFC